MTHPDSTGKTTRPLVKYDIVIVGAGPAGLLLSTCLARWGYNIKHIDNRPEPTKTGRADGIQPRSLDLLRNMGLKPAIMAHDPAKVYEVAFWDPGQTGQGIQRTGTWASCPSFIDARYPFTTLLHQGLIERVFIDDLRKNGVTIQRPWTIKGFKTDGEMDREYPVEVKIEHVDGKEKEIVRAKYLFSGEGARSFVRDQLHIGIKHKDPIAHMKCTIHSDNGSIMVIPRENNMVRLYIQIASSTDKDWNPRKTASEKEVQNYAKRILQPYKIEWERVEWYSVYPIGQGIADKYTLDHRVFMGGDACHTHSPKAGQGMNTAFLDAQNLAWKIHHVESGFADRSLLHSYESERKLIAENLLNFDAKYAALFSQRPPAAKDVAAATKQSGDEADEENQFIKTFKEACEFTSGYGVAYNPNSLNWSSSHPAQSSLINPSSNKLRTGRILINSNVTRVVDANTVHLEQEIPVNGSFRIYVFGGKPSVTSQATKDFAQNLNKKTSFFSSYLRQDIESVSHHECHNPHSHFFTFCTIYGSRRSDIEIRRDVPDVLARYRDHVYADDIWDPKVPDATASAHAKMGLDQEKGGVVVVRPDGYVGIVVTLAEGSGTIDALNDYFSTFYSILHVFPTLYSSQSATFFEMSPQKRKATEDLDRNSIAILEPMQVQVQVQVPTMRETVKRVFIPHISGLWSWCWSFLPASTPPPATAYTTMSYASSDSEYVVAMRGIYTDRVMVVADTHVQYSEARKDSATAVKRQKTKRTEQRSKSAVDGYHNRGGKGRPNFDGCFNKRDFHERHEEFWTPPNIGLLKKLNEPTQLPTPESTPESTPEPEYGQITCQHLDPYASPRTPKSPPSPRNLKPISAFTDSTSNSKTTQVAESPESSQNSRNQQTYNGITSLEERLEDLLLTPEENKKADSPFLFPSERVEARRQLAAKERQRKEIEAAEERLRKEKEASLLAARALRLTRRNPKKALVQPLNSKWEDAVIQSQYKNHQEIITTSIGGTELRLKDFQTLLGRHAWLNDEIINSYLEWIVDAANIAAISESKDRGESQSTIPKFIAHNSFFYENLIKKGPSATQGLMKRKKAPGKSLMEVDSVLVPICKGSHWTIGVVRPVAKTIEYFDSMGGDPRPFVTLMRNWLRFQLGSLYVEGEWNVPQTACARQSNGYDCGVFLCTNAFCVALGLDTSCYRQHDMELQRRNIAAVLINRGFTGEFEWGKGGL
ncbi:hypothetical protein B7494_g6107 [Chlorociboria aeruginascens]|nr:hypothetical protein B7494_g6107 [Chlorociboria aeruginascens]